MRLGAAELSAVAEELRRAEHAEECALLVIGVKGADLETLELLAPRATHLLERLDFGRILDLVFQSSDRAGRGTAAEVSEQLDEYAANADALDNLEEEYR